MSEPAPAYWAVIKPLFAKIDTGGSPETFLASIAGLPRSEVGLFAAHLFLAEIYNGGFLQFFWNAAGVVSPEAIDGFNAVGMPLLAALLKDTAAPLGDPYPRDRDERWDALLMAARCGKTKLSEIMKEVSTADEDSKSHPALTFYRVFVKATASLEFDRLNEQALQLAENENGGFADAANRYLASFSAI